MIVADTNLLAYLLLEGPRTSAAEAVHARDSAWVAPPLWRSELRNVLVLAVRHAGLARSEAEAAWEGAAALVTEHEPDPRAVLEVALARHLSAYDAEFVALAEALGVALVTDDRRVLAASPGVAVALDAFARDADAGPEGGAPDEGGR